LKSCAGVIFRQPGLRPRGGDDERAVAVHERVADLPDLPVFLVAVDLQVGDGGAEHRVPVHQALAAVDQALFVQPHEHLDDGAGHALVHGEVARIPAV
jgi:hypothetical protein